MPDGPAVSIVIPTLGTRETLGRVLDGLDAQTAPRESFEVIVAVDLATPDPADVDAAVGGRGLPLRRVSGAVPGAAANRNAAVMEAQAPLILFIDDDTLPAPGLVAEHLAWHGRHPEEEVGVLGLIRWAPELEVTTFMRWLDTGIQFDYANIDGTEAGWGRFYTGNVSLKASFFRRVGDFEAERLPYPYEDTDWASRADKLGFRLLYDNRAVVDHLRPTTLASWQERARALGAAEYAYSRRHPDQRPWFRYLLERALEGAPARTRGVALEPYVPRWIPWAGRRVRESVDAYYKQAIAPHFFAGWEAAAEAAEGGEAPSPADGQRLQ